MSTISLFNTLFYVSLGVAVLGLLLAAFFFFYFDIPTVRALMTGSAKRKAIENMNEQNSRTGKLRAHMTESPAPRKGPVIQQPHQLRHEANAPTEPTGVSPESRETTILRNELETTILRDEDATTVLNREEEAGETVILSSVAAERSTRFEMTENTIVVHTNEFI